MPKKTPKSDDAVLDMAETIKKTLEPSAQARLAALIAPTAPTARMSAQSFAELMDTMAAGVGRGFSQKSLEAARQYYVMGANQSEAAEAAGLTRQAVCKLILRIERNRAAAPAGWAQVAAWWPPELAQVLGDLADRVRSASGSPAELEKIAAALRGAV